MNKPVPGFKKFERSKHQPRCVLDRLPEKLTVSLAKKMASDTETLATIGAWLAEKHGVKISRNGLSVWWRKRVAESRNNGIEEATTRAVAGTFEVTVHAPGARQVFVRIAPGQLHESILNRAAVFCGQANQSRKNPNRNENKSKTTP